jgi:hypothetical protein
MVPYSASGNSHRLSTQNFDATPRPLMSVVLCLIVKRNLPQLLFMRLRMRRYHAIFGFLFILALSGCGGDAFPTVSTTGTVTCNGKPVEGALVYFEPIRGQSGTQGNAIVGKQGFSWTDSEGKFAISTYDPGGEDGAVVGKHRVRVGKGKSNCDCETNDEKDLMEVDVIAEGENTFELVLPKKAARQRNERDGDADDDE